jgi:putative NADPH-quinone reductase
MGDVDSPEVLIVHAHPSADSFTAAARDAICRGLDRAQRSHHVLDLYAEGFRAAMTREERHVYETETPVLDPQVAEHIELLRGARTLVFAYPTWWSGLPAVLKGWLERVMVLGVGFVFDERTRQVRPGLTHLRRIVGVSAYGSSWAYVKLFNDNGRRTIGRTLRLSAGWRTRVEWLAMYGIDTSTAEQRQRFLARVEQAAARW